MNSNWRNAKRSTEPGEKPNSFIGLPREKSSTPIVGWRTWKVVEHNSKCYLGAAHVDIVWKSPVMTTNVLPSMKLAPISLGNKAVIGSESRGDYGIYSYKTLANLLRWHGVFGGVLGTVECYGQVIEHEFGYRAQKAIIKELWINHTFDGHPGEKVNARRDFEEIYQCPVTIITGPHWESFVKEHESNV